MRDDDIQYDAPHSSRAHIADLLDERRVELSNGIVTRMRRREGVTVSPLIVRTLVHALAKSIADSAPDIVVHWSRMVRHAHPATLVVAMVDTACEAVEELAHDEHGDLATIVVFLEIVKARASAQMLDEVPAPRTDADAASHAAIESLLAMLRARDDATCNHSRATGEWGRRIATRMGLNRDTTERIVRAGILHDIGKIRVPDAILLKPTALEAHEWEIMKRHAEAGADILSQIPALAQYAPIVGTHHEWFDGRGYPYGLRGDEISLESRVVSVADSFHAMTSDRPYRRALTYGEAIAALADGRGRQWDKAVADVMIALAAEDRNSSADANLTALATPFFSATLSRDIRAI
ncbi:MAG: response regulator receiver modulated metal dependent phosphohydrolase [Candidatus Eremiobacteraeota bacterium]|nr:response regulator receiver modulated metal dependent phosphohydrolase [Candidatus Eremiobacteraeota bacterium]